MGTFRSNLPLGTSDPTVFVEGNVPNLDEAMNSQQPEWVNRFGVNSLTYRGVLDIFNESIESQELRFQDFLSSSGYSGWETQYAAGIVLNSHNQGFTRCEPDGTACMFYTPLGTTPLPYTTTGDWSSESALFVARSADDVLRQDLADPKGAGISGFSQSEIYRDGSIGKKAQQAVIVNNQRGAIAIAGVIRRDPSISENWQTIQDAAHKPLNWVGPTGSGVDQRIEFTGGPVGAIVIGADETFAKDGVTAGISGGNGGAIISMGAPCTFEADVETLQITRHTARYYAQSRLSISRNESTGLITVTHPSTTTHQRPLIQYRAKNSQGEVLIPSYITSTGVGAGSTTFFLVGSADGGVTYTGSNWTLSGSAWASSDVSFEWDSDSGVLKVNHPRVLLSQGTSPRVQLSLGGASATPHFLIGFDVSETSFRVKFITHDNQVPVLNTGLGFYFSRGMTAIRKNPVGSVMVDIGRAQVNMSHVDAPSGNLWCLGINNIS